MATAKKTTTAKKTSAAKKSAPTVKKPVVSKTTKAAATAKKPVSKTSSAAHDKLKAENTALKARVKELEKLLKDTVKTINKAL